MRAIGDGCKCICLEQKLKDEDGRQLRQKGAADGRHMTMIRHPSVRGSKPQAVVVLRTEGPQAKGPGEATRAGKWARVGIQTVRGRGHDESGGFRRECNQQDRPHSLLLPASARPRARSV